MKLEQLLKYPLYEKCECTITDPVTRKVYKLRFMREDDNTVFVFARGSKSRGFRRDNDTFIKYYDAEDYDAIKDKRNKKFYADLKKASNKLQMSGLWDDYKEVLDNLLTVDPADKDDIVELWLNSVNNRSNTAYYDDYAEKYPFMFSKNKEGVYKADYTYLDLMNRKKLGLKSMYFGKSTKDEKIEIKCAIEDRRPYSTRARTSYDVSFDYDPGKGKAWYSEEYKDCGNGHYYIALDESTALFIEND